MKTAFRTERGPRENLEDAVHVFSITPLLAGFREAVVLMVLDGVGGINHGEVASNLAGSELGAYLAGFLAAHQTSSNTRSLPPATILEMLRQALACANEAVCQRAREDAELRGMATTVVCGVIVGERLYLAWAGDSRCYLHRHGSLHRLTRDHREIEPLIDMGLISQEEAPTHPLAHHITRYLGQPSSFVPSAVIHDLQAGDVLLMCSDGLTDVLADQNLADMISACRAGFFPFTELPGRLVDQALRADAQDNVTVVCCEYQPEDQARSSSIERTLTGVYPVGLAIGLCDIFKEPHND